MSVIQYVQIFCRSITPPSNSCQITCLHAIWKLIFLFIVTTIMVRNGGNHDVWETFLSTSLVCTLSPIILYKNNHTNDCSSHSGGLTLQKNNFKWKQTSKQALVVSQTNTSERLLVPEDHKQKKQTEQVVTSWVRLLF